MCQSHAGSGISGLLTKNSRVEVANGEVEFASVAFVFRPEGEQEVARIATAKREYVDIIAIRRAIVAQEINSRRIAERVEVVFCKVHDSRRKHCGCLIEDVARKVSGKKGINLYAACSLMRLPVLSRGVGESEAFAETALIVRIRRGWEAVKMSLAMPLIPKIILSSDRLTSPTPGMLRCCILVQCEHRESL